MFFGFGHQNMIMVFFFLTIIKYTLHIVYHFINLKVYNLVALCTITMLCNPNLTFLSCSKKTLYPLSNHSLFPSIPQPLGTTKLPSVSMNFPILGISSKWNHTIWSFLCLASFIQHVFSVYPCYSMHQYFIFYGWIIFHHMGILHFVYLFISWWILGTFYPLAIESAAMNIPHKSLFEHIFSILLGIYLGVELLDRM